MKIPTHLTAALAAWLASALGAAAQGTAFTYQGQLQNNGQPANGWYDLQFGLYDGPTGGNEFGGFITNSATLVTNGLFTVTLDFGNQFRGAGRWLEVDVRTNGAPAFSPLAPRQAISTAPYAVTAFSVTGTLTAAQLTSVGNSNGGSGNFFVGPSGNADTFGSDNAANGYEALYSNTSGSDNTAIGSQALYLNTSGHDNTANGMVAALYNESGSYNTADGSHALCLNTSGSYNIALGYQAGYNIFSGSYNIDIGNPGLATDTNIIRIGNGQTQTFVAGTLVPAGSVGIGTANPAAPLHVLGGSSYVTELVDNNNTSGTWEVLKNGSTGGRYWNLVSTGSGNGEGPGKLIIGNGASLGFMAVEAIVISSDGNVGIGNSSPGQLLTVGSGGAYCNGTTWVNGSDRASKEGFTAIDPAEVLKKVAALPISEWQYKAAPDQAHIGPMAQDFHAAFGLNGADDKHISTVDEGGVALAAIQGLNEKLETENADLKHQLEALKQVVNALQEKIGAKQP